MRHIDNKLVKYNAIAKHLRQYGGGGLEDRFIYVFDLHTVEDLNAKNTIYDFLTKIRSGKAMSFKRKQDEIKDRADDGRVKNGIILDLL